MLDITRNLLSVSQFSKDNAVLFEFHSSVCFVKDQVTGEVLLQGSLKDGLYHFHLTNSTNQSHQPSLKSFSLPIKEPVRESSATRNRNFSAFLCPAFVGTKFDVSLSNPESNVSVLGKKADLDLWHQRLGHPAYEIVETSLKEL